MAISIPQNFFKETITLAAAAGAINLYVSALPDNDTGYLVISPNNSSSREIVKFTAKGTDGSGNYVTITLANRGLGGTSDIAHSVDEPVYMNVTAQHLQEIDDAIEAINTSGALDASTTTKGVAKLSVAPETASDPKAVGDNDPRIPSTEQALFLSTLTGMVFPFFGTTVPTGFLNCDGQLIDHATYPTLVEMFGVKFGHGTATDCTADTGDLITNVGHGLAAETVIFFESNDTLPAGLTRNTIYYVRDVTTNTFKVETTIGGGAVDITSTGTGSLTYYTQVRIPDLRSGSPIGDGQRTKTITCESADITAGTLIATATSANTSSNFITTAAAHGVASGQSILVQGGTVPSTLAADTPYYGYRPVSSTRLSFMNTYFDAKNANTGAYNEPGTINITNATATCSVYRGAGYKVNTPMSKELTTGTIVTISTDGTLPAGLVAGDYYFHRVDDYNFGLCKTFEAALAGEHDAIRTVGSGTMTLTFTLSESRSVGDEGGEEKHINSVTEMANHGHKMPGDQDAANGPAYLSYRSDANSATNTNYTDRVGDNTPANNMQPFAVAKWIIKT